MKNTIDMRMPQGNASAVASCLSGLLDITTGGIIWARYGENAGSEAVDNLAKEIAEMVSQDMVDDWWPQCESRMRMALETALYDIDVLVRCLQIYKKLNPDHKSIYEI